MMLICASACKLRVSGPHDGMPGVCARAQELALLASDSFMTLSGRDEPRGHIPALPNTPGKDLLTVWDQTRIQFAPRRQEKRV